MARDTATRASLLDRLRDAEDPLAWREFFDRYARAMYAFARSVGCRDHTAEEVVQDAMLQVFQSRLVFRYDPARGRFRNWLLTVVRQKAALRRRQDARAPAAAPLAEAADPPAETEAIWETAFENALLVALLETVRKEVEPSTYQAFELTALHGMSASRAGRFTGLSRNAVYLARKRVLRRLRELGATYHRTGQLDRRVQEALAACPPPAAERSLATRIETTMADRGAPQT